MAMDEATLWSLKPLIQVALAGALIASVPLAWLFLRRGAQGGEAVLDARVRRLAALILFLTFDLVLFGAFTRLTDSGLGCPDWPGCYGSASPVGAHAHIEAAQSAMPTGPVTHRKAWIEMIHRYLASAVGVLIIVLTAATAWAARRHPHFRPHLAWAVASLVWVIVQGLFGMWTVTLKLYPAIVTAHLLGGLGLLALLAVQVRLPQPVVPLLPAVRTALRRSVALVFVIAVTQIALGGWVSTNYAVLACTDFPTCHGAWWPEMDFSRAFRVLRPLGQDGSGNWLGSADLTAIHMAHRLGAAVTLAALLWLGWRLWRTDAPHGQLRRWARAAWALAAWQFASGLSNVVLGWPLVAALAHTGGAAALVVLLTFIGVGTRPPPRS